MMQRILWILALAGTLAATAAAAVVTEDWSKQFSTALRLGDCELALQILSDARRTRAEGAEYAVAPGEIGEGYNGVEQVGSAIAFSRKSPILEYVGKCEQG